MLTRFGNAVRRVFLRQKDVAAELRKLGMVLTKKDGEYRVNFKGGREGTAYYTTDLADALATGKHMAGRCSTHGNRRVKPYRPKYPPMRLPVYKPHAFLTAEQAARDYESYATYQRREAAGFRRDAALQPLTGHRAELRKAWLAQAKKHDRMAERAERAAAKLRGRR